MKIIVDFETMSPVDLTKAGNTKYLRHPEADIIFMGYKVIGSKSTAPTNVWHPNLVNLPTFMKLVREAPNIRQLTMYAFNVAFDYNVWKYIGVNKYDFPRIPLENWIDVQALCGRFTFPQNLKQAAKAVTGGDVMKDPAGKKLIREITQPPFNYSHDRYEQFRNYCAQDVRATYAILNSLPLNHLSPREQDIWVLTQKINALGLPVDETSINKIYRITTNYMESKLEEISDASGGYITSINQTAKIVEFCRLRGVMMDNCQAATVEGILNEYESDPVFGPSEVRELLELRSALGKNSVKKYTTLASSIHCGRIHQNLRYYGTSTGRWSGQGFQAHNLPRDSVKDPEAEIQKFNDTTILDEDPIHSAKALIRPMIKSTKHMRLIVADYSGIENRLLFWATGEHAVLEEIKKGLDTYKTVAAETFGVPYDEVDSKLRQRGKTIVLGAGFGLAEGGYIEYAKGFGLDIGPEESQATIQGFRNRYPLIPTYWYDNINAAVTSIQNPGYPVSVRGNRYCTITDHSARQWLKLTIPSGRNLYYCNPKLETGPYGLSIKHKGIHPKSHQWSWRWLPPSRLTENIIQALARDIMADHMLIMYHAGFTIILTVHDEIICETAKIDADWMLEDMFGVMRVSPHWCQDLPLDAEGYVSQRYKKG